MAIQRAKRVAFCSKRTALSRDRTSDLTIFSRALSQLSYQGLCAAGELLALLPAAAAAVAAAAPPPPPLSQRRGVATRGTQLLRAHTQAGGEVVRACFVTGGLCLCTKASASTSESKGKGAISVIVVSFSGLCSFI